MACVHQCLARVRSKARPLLGFPSIFGRQVDKLTPLESAINIKRLTEAYDLPPELPVQFSAVTGQGKKEVWGYIRQAAAGG